MGKGIADKRHHNERVSEKRYKVMKDIVNHSDKIKTVSGWRNLSDFKGYYKKHHPLSCGCDGCAKNTIHGKRVLSIAELKQKERDEVED